ncbi:hypothetical protein Pmani_019772 [Petrolisthes manimaculis]|uniref:Cyclase n=1 Tax=Petrolisthes manimaculis TaxID=1843537 RepID=A0AAE1PJR1_9EUCA|nr:hypothetical protein Pmani_019772 [Petrolisthes manimaculis]
MDTYARFSLVFTTVIVILQASRAVVTRTLDIGYTLSEDSANWPTNRPIEIISLVKGLTPKGFWYEANVICMNEHSSTHLDAPSHFSEGAWSVDRIPLNHLIVPGVVMDIQEKVAKDSLAELTAEDVMAWLDKHGPLPDRAIVLVRTGWASRYGNKTAYFGTDTKITSKLAFPGINVGAARIFSGYEEKYGRRVVGVGLDTPSQDHGPSTHYPTHIELAAANIYGLENLADMSELPTKGFQLMVMPMNVKGGSGAPVRVIATIPDPDGDLSSGPPTHPLGQLLYLTPCLTLLVTLLLRP